MHQFIIAFAIIALSCNLSAREVTKSEKKFNIDSDPLRYSLGIRNVKGRYKVSDKSTLGLTFYDYNVKFEETSDLKVIGNTFGAEYMYFIGGPTFSDSSFIKAEVGLTKMQAVGNNEANRNFKFGDIEVSGEAKGVQVFVNYGYNWQWDYFSLNLYGGVQYYNLSMDAQATNNSTTLVQDKKTISGSGLDLGVQMGVTF